MAEAIYCRIKFAFILLLFFLPILASMWDRQLDSEFDQVRYLPPPQSFAWMDYDDDPPVVPTEIADASDPLLSGFPD